MITNFSLFVQAIGIVFILCSTIHTCVAIINLTLRSNKTGPGKVLSMNKYLKDKGPKK